MGVRGAIETGELRFRKPLKSLQCPRQTSPGGRQTERSLCKFASFCSIKLDADLKVPQSPEAALLFTVFFPKLYSSLGDAHQTTGLIWMTGRLEPE